MSRALPKGHRGRLLAAYELPGYQSFLVADHPKE